MKKVGGGNRDEGGSPMIAEISRSEVEGGSQNQKLGGVGGCQNPPERKTSFKCFWPGPIYIHIITGIQYVSVEIHIIIHIEYMCIYT